MQIGSVATGGAPPLKYSWLPPDGLSATNVAQPTASPTQTTYYNVTVTDSNGCQVSAQVNVYVIPSPHPTITASATLLCEGDTATITANDSNYTAYLWNTGDIRR